MILGTNVSRRAALTGPAALLLASSASACDAEEKSGTRPRSKTLVAFFSRSGNTRVIAGQLHRALGTDLFEIQPAQPYPEDYEEQVAQAGGESASGFEPPLKASVPTIAGYDSLFLGFPIWGMTAPPIIRAFLSTHDLSGKTIRPFITHGGYGLGDSISAVRSHAPRSKVLDAFSMEADQEKRTLSQVTNWLREVMPS
jgi:flavodoxin